MKSKTLFLDHVGRSPFGPAIENSLSAYNLFDLYIQAGALDASNVGADSITHSGVPVARFSVLIAPLSRIMLIDKSRSATDPLIVTAC